MPMDPIEHSPCHLFSGRAVPIICYVLLLLSGTLYAEYDSLSVTQRHLLDSLLNSYQLEYCCSMPILTCLDLKKECSIARRFQTFTTWIVGTDPDPDPDPVKVKEQLDLRYTGFTTGETAVIDTSRLQLVGNPIAPVVITVYVSANCPLCKHVVGDLYDSVTTGKNIKNNVALIAKPIGGGIGNIALIAAAEEGRFWDLFLALKRVYTTLKTEDDVLHVAGKAGITSENFKKRLSDPATKHRLTVNAEESKRNKVQYMPTFFINNKRYSSYKDARWVVDAALYEYERVKGK